MPIEFRCDQCQTLLRVADDAAGRQARCPKCSKLLAVPEQSDVVTATLADGAVPGAPPAVNPYASPSLGPGLSTVRFEVGEMLSRAWKLYIDNIGNCLLAVLAIFGVTLGAVAVLSLIGVVLGVGMAAALKENAVFLIIPLVAVLVAVIMVVAAWLQMGFTVYCLKLARGEPVKIGEIFERGRMLWTYIGVTIALGLLVSLGFTLCIVPGVLLILVYFPAPYLVIDRDLSFSEAFSTAAELTRGKRGDIFLLILVSIGISMIANFIPLGSVLVLPLRNLLLIMGYLQLTGQPTAGAKEGA